MDSGQDRLLQFDRDLLSGKNICSSEGIFVNFPPSLKRPFQMKGLGLIICRQGNFQFSLNQKKHFAKVCLFPKTASFRFCKSRKTWRCGF
mgnify:FL=1